MTYSEKKERSHRFVLALRMGLPIFFLSALTFFVLLNKHTESIFESFVLVLIALLIVIVYFIFYLIYQSTRENITDPVTHTFTPDYFSRLLKKALPRDTQTLMMVSLQNLSSINERYGIKNGDAVLRNTVKIINHFFKTKGHENLPICRFRGGDFLLLLPGRKEEYIPLLELFLTKYQNQTESDIEIHLEGVMVDTRLSGDTDQLISRLYELHHDRIAAEKEEPYSITELEKEVAEALEESRYSIGFRPLCCEGKAIYDTSVKLVDSKGRLIHQSRYVPILNRLNLMRRLESAVLETIGSICDARERFFIVPVSPVTLRNPHFFEHALTLFERYPRARQKITLMFEEREYCHQLERFAQQIAHYRRAGYKIALDRLGGYHTTMLYMKELEVDMVRFDPLYSRHIKEVKYQSLLQGLNLSAHLCGAETWIPMIEDEHSDYLAQSLKINCREGNYHGKILTLNEIQGQP